MCFSLIRESLQCNGDPHLTHAYNSKTHKIRRKLKTKYIGNKNKLKNKGEPPWSNSYKGGIWHVSEFYILTTRVAQYCSDSVVLQSLSRRMHQAFIAVCRLVCIMCYRRNCQTTRSENWFGTHLPCLWTCDLRHMISVFLMFFFKFMYSCALLFVCLTVIWRNNK